MIISGSIHVAANGIISFFYGLVVFHCMYIPHLLYLFICPWTFSLLQRAPVFNHLWAFVHAVPPALNALFLFLYLNINIFQVTTYTSSVKSSLIISAHSNFLLSANLQNLAHF